MTAGNKAACIGQRGNDSKGTRKRTRQQGQTSRTTHHGQSKDKTARERNQEQNRKKMKERTR
jgi:hypothetical protein